MKYNALAAAALKEAIKRKVNVRLSVLQSFTPSDKTQYDKKCLCEMQVGYSAAVSGCSAAYGLCLTELLHL